MVRNGQGGSDEPIDFHVQQEAWRRALVIIEQRSVIERAKGALMATHGFTGDEAFGYLCALSSRTNVKVRDVAAELLEDLDRDDRSAPLDLRGLEGRGAHDLPTVRRT